MMELQTKLLFNDLVQYLVELPSHDWEKLKATVDNNRFKSQLPRKEFLELLLNGPVATKADLKRIKKNRKTLNALGRSL
jgi:hypothetical protein